LKEPYRDIFASFVIATAVRKLSANILQRSVDAGERALIEFGHGLSPLRRQKFGRPIFPETVTWSIGFLTSAS
jgi:hypothetical protein